MDLAIPAKLQSALADRYVIERAIGQGGMAMVFLARDVRHDRLVALKVLRPELAAVIGAERFLTEIKVTANLQHPHILPLHDSGAADGTVFYVMPYVEGESLRDRIAREHQLPVAEALRIAKEVASALDYAHRRGVVHRDIKPENILLHEGQALIADFGIALAVSRTESTSRMTETGMSLGTPHYMSPEQAMGEREITARADVYALGAVLYEMLAGDPPFTGGTAQAVVARALTERPRGLTIQRHTVPVHVESTVLKALEKLPADRFASAADFATALDDPTRTADTRMTPAIAAARGSRDPWRLGMAMVAVAALAGLAWTFTRTQPLAPMVRYALAFPRNAQPAPDRTIQISADGRTFGYIIVNEAGTRQIYLKSAGESDGRLRPGTDGVLTFSFSPDGQHLVVVTGGNVLLRMPVDGGPSIELTRGASGSAWPAWLEDGTIVFGRSDNRRLLAVPSDGGPVDTLWKSDSGSVAIASGARGLPGGRFVLFTRCNSGYCASTAEIMALDVRKRTLSTVAAGFIRAIPAGKDDLLLIRSEGGVLASRIDLSTAELLVSPVALFDSVSIGLGNAVQLAIADDGTLISRRGGVSSSLATYELVWMDRAGRETVVDQNFRFQSVVFGGNNGWSISPDGRRVALGASTSDGDNIWVKELPDGPLSRLTFDSAPSIRPRWSRDGRFVYYVQRKGTNTYWARRQAEGTGGVEVVFDGARPPGLFEAVLSPDGRTMVYRDGGTVSIVGGRDIRIAEVGADSTRRDLLASERFDESGIALSPNGRWLAYESNESGRTEVYLRPFPDVEGGRWQISNSGGRAPLWSRDGREFFFVDGNRALVAVSIGAMTAAGAPQIGARRPLFAMRAGLYLTPQENYTPFDIGADGRFLMARRVDTPDEDAAPLIVTLNFRRELERVLRNR